MKNYYFLASHQDYDESFICSFREPLKPNAWIIVDLYGRGITTARINKAIDELRALTSNEEILEIICSPQEIPEYEKRKEKRVQEVQLLRQMEEKSKEVALLEKFKKNSNVSPEFAELYNQYQKLHEQSQPPVSNLTPNFEED